MISLKIQSNKTTLHLSHPEALNELDEHQFRAVVSNCFMNEIPLSTRIDDRIRLMNVLLKKSINKYVKNKWYNVVDDMVNEGIIEDILNLQNFIWSQGQIFLYEIWRIYIGRYVIYGLF